MALKKICTYVGICDFVPFVNILLWCFVVCLWCILGKNTEMDDKICLTLAMFSNNWMVYVFGFEISIGLKYNIICSRF